MKYFLGIFFITLTFLAVVPYTAQAATREEMLAKIEALKEMLSTLKLEMQERLFEENRNFNFQRDLEVGSSGFDVSKLQTFLADNTQFYPEKLITGYYGPLTDQAVTRLKREYDIEEEGFGKESRETLNDLFKKRSTFVVSTSGFALEPAKSRERIDSALIDEEENFDIETREIARDIHVAINKIRSRNGLNALVWDESLATVALSHSRDQAKDNLEVTNSRFLCQYPLIRHEGFENGFTVRDRVITAGVPFRSVGENIAMIPNVKTRTYSFNFEEEAPVCLKRSEFTIESITDKAEYSDYVQELLEKSKSSASVNFLRIERYKQEEIVNLAVEGWMNSQGHRENILFPEYTHAGIGIIEVNEYFIITHNFIGR